MATMCDILLNHPQIKSGSSLAQAAECLARTAATLSEAAQAMSIAANTFCSEILNQPSESNNLASLPAGSAPSVSHVSDLGSSTTQAAEVMDEVLPQLDSAEGQDGINLRESSDQLSTISDDQLPKDLPESDQNFAPLDIHTETKVATEPNQAYHILVDNEADILLIACALIDKRRKVVCYMNCSLPAFNLYKRLINDITQTPVHTITKTTPAELEVVGSNFLKDRSSILLLPETVYPNLKLGEADSWVIHIGWPADEHNYEAQKLAHEARNNILVAYSEDQELYAAGPAIISHSEPWPGDAEAFRASVSALRPMFNDKLNLIPSEMKAKVYPDWIACHGSRGRRYVCSWTPVELVQRANSYLLDVLRYGGSESEGPGSNIQVLLPEVSPGFVTHNGLESAVMEGVLEVKSSPGINHISSLSKGDFAPSSTASLNEKTTLGGVYRPTPSFTFGTAVNDASQWDSATTFIPRFSPGRSSTIPDLSKSGMTSTTHPRRNAFQSTTGHTYFALKEEFDAVPLICFLAMAPGRRRVVLFFEDAGSITGYQQLIHQVAGRLAITPELVNDDQSNEDAASQFVAHRGPAILLLSYNYKKLPAALETTSLDCCIYWGTGDYVPLIQAKKHRSRLDCRLTSIIMTIPQKQKLEKSLKDIQEHPSSADLLNLNSSSWLSSMRDATRSALIANKQIAKSLYEAHLHFLASVPRSVRSAEEVARRVNQYSARILLRGKMEDGSENFPPIAQRFVTRPEIIRNFDLNPAVVSGLLVVG